MKLLLVSHRTLDQAGGTVARWRGLRRELIALGWQVDVVSAPIRTSAVEFTDKPEDLKRVLLRAKIMHPVRKIVTPILAVLGLRPEAVPLATFWVWRGARDVRRALSQKQYDVVLATMPYSSAVIAGRLATRGNDAPPFVAELRDLWADNPAFEARPGLLGLLERWVFRGADAVVAVTPEAVENLKRRYPRMSDRIYEITNGFDPELYGLRKERKPAEKITILHSGSLTLDRPITPILDVLSHEPYRSRFRLVHQGFTSPETEREIAAHKGGLEVEVLPPTTWREAVETVASADVAMISQAASTGDKTAVAGKLYEYIALGKPVFCVSHGGGCERLLTDLNTNQFCARMDDPDSIAAALDKLLAEDLPGPLPDEQIYRFDRRFLAGRMSELLKAVAAGEPEGAIEPLVSDAAGSRNS